MSAPNTTRVESRKACIDLVANSTQALVCVQHRRAQDVSAVALALAEHAASQGKRVAVVYTGCAALLQPQLGSFEQLSAEHILDIDDVCLRVLQDAYTATDLRKPRVLDANEMDILVEDLKVTGLKQQRLREMLKFFYRSIAEYETETDGWMATAEEDMVFNILMANLNARQAYLPYEIANVAFHALAGTPAYDHIYVLGFDDLSKSQQRFVGALAGEKLVAFGTGAAVAFDGQDYPYAEGFTALQNTEDALNLELCDSALAAAEQLRCATTPLLEFSDVAQVVEQHMADGMRPEDIVVAVPNKVWAKHLAEELAAKNVATAVLERDKKLAGDPRSADGCTQIKALTALKLVANPHDEVALRSWLGLGEWLMNSDAFGEMMAYLQTEETTMLKALDAVRAAAGEADVPFANAQRFYYPLQLLDQLVLACVDKTGSALLDALAQGGIEVPAWVHRLTAEGDSAAAIVDKALAGTGRACGCVTIATYKNAARIPAKLVCITGLVNGYLPKLDALSDGKTIDYKTRIMAHEQDLFEQLCACAGEQLSMSYFERDRFENADALHMQVERIVMKDGVRLALLAPSVFIADRLGKE